VRLGYVLNQEPELNHPDMRSAAGRIQCRDNYRRNDAPGLYRQKNSVKLNRGISFTPNKVVIQAGILTDMSFPGSKFYFKRTPKKDLLFFIGEEQPATRESAYAEGKRAYEMGKSGAGRCPKILLPAGLYIRGRHCRHPPYDASQSLGGCQPEAAVIRTPQFDNTILMSEVEGKGNQGSITGLNGLLIGAAKRRGMEGICLMGEIPDYYPGCRSPTRKHRSGCWNTVQNYGRDHCPQSPRGMITQMDTVVENVYQQFPPEIKERLEQRKSGNPDQTGSHQRRGRAVV